MPNVGVGCPVTNCRAISTCDCCKLLNLAGMPSTAETVSSGAAASRSPQEPVRPHDHHPCRSSPRPPATRSTIYHGQVPSVGFNVRAAT
jgi:hypothetical protein